MVAWRKTAWPQLASRCWFCGAPRGHLCVTAGGRVFGGRWSPRYQRWASFDFHKGRGGIPFRLGHGHGKYDHCYPHDGTLWERFVGGDHAPG